MSGSGSNISVQQYILDVLQDNNGGTYSSESIARMIRARRIPIFATLTNISSTVLDSDIAFWLEPVTGTATTGAEAPYLSISINGTEQPSSSYSIDYLSGEVTLLGGTVSERDIVTATFFAVNAWSICADLMMRSLSDTTVSGEKKSIRLGPLLKSVTGPYEMVKSRQEMIKSFQMFAQQWMKRKGRQRWMQK